MFNAVGFGKQILDRRKVQGLTQEQLGAELGVSGQSISKWENGDTVPDLSLIPSICRVLNISSDTLLGIDVGVGIETLGKELSRRIFAQKAPEELFMQAIAYLHSKAKGAVWNLGSKATDVAFSFCKNRLTGMDMWNGKGFAVFVREAILSGHGTSGEQIQGIRTLVAPGNWEIAQYLLNGPAKENAIIEAGIIDNPENLSVHLSEMINAGLVIQDRNGYRLDDDWGLIWSCVIKVLSHNANLGCKSMDWGEKR